MKCPLDEFESEDPKAAKQSFPCNGCPNVPVCFEDIPKKKKEEK